MAKQSEVIEGREFESSSRQWYRRIGGSRYRFRVNWKADGKVEIIAHVYVGWNDWQCVHKIKLNKKLG